MGFVAHLLGTKGVAYGDKLLSTLYLMLSMSSLNQMMNKSKIGKIGEQMRWILMIGLLSADRLFGMDKLPKIVSKTLRFNSGTLMSGLKDSYKTIGTLLTVAFAGWSWRNQLFHFASSDKIKQETPKCNQDEIDMKN